MFVSTYLVYYVIIIVNFLWDLKFWLFKATSINFFLVFLDQCLDGFRTILRPLIALLMMRYSLKRVFKEKVYLKNLVEELLFVNSVVIMFFKIAF